MEHIVHAWRRIVTFAPALVRFGRGICSLVLLLAIAVTSPLHAQQAATGSVQGRVLNLGTNKYLNNARVVVDGTNIEAFTNEYGDFRLDGVPAGPVTIRASFTGLDAESTTVEVAPGQTIRADFSLTNRGRYGDEKTVVLDNFVVAASREFEGNAIATNEQRYAPNVKVVMAADAFGDVTEGNAGEFLKYLPGVTVDYVAADVRTVSVRGFAANFTNVYLDGMRTTSSASGASGRIFEFEQVSINNAARVEVVKVPTPDLPADSLGGSVNLISKNAFEEKGASFSYRAYLSFNSENTDLFSKTPGPGRDETYKVLPGFDFTYTLPVNDRFGIVVTGLSSNQFNEQHRWQTTYNFAQGGGSPTNPYLQQWQIQDGPKNTFRDSVSVKADWKISDTQTLSVMAQDNYYKAFFGNRNLNFNIGTNATSSVSGGAPRTYGPDFVQSAQGRTTSTNFLGDRAQVSRGSSFRDKLGDTKAVNLKYTYNGPEWNADFGAHLAKSKTWYRALTRGQFSNVGSRMLNVGTVRADNIAFPDHNWEVRDPSGNVIDPYDLSNYLVTTMRNDPIDGKAKMKGAFIDFERDLDTAVPLSVKFGVATREEDRDNRRYQEDYQFLGADGRANTLDDNAGIFLDEEYSGEDPHWGEPNIQWLNPYELADYFRANPSHFRLGTNSSEDGVQAEFFRRQNSEKITERVDAAYVQLDGKLLDNRLQFVGGVRLEKTTNTGEGLLRTDGTTPTTWAALEATTVERGFKTSRKYDDYYPSLHLTYNITDNLLARFAYAKTLGRPDYVNLIPQTTIDENEGASIDPTLSPGSVTIRNPSLLPWTADNFELSLEYYFPQSGVFSVGVFRKDLQDFFVTRSGVIDAALAGELGLGSEYVGWSVSTTVNGGDAMVSGAEFNLVRQLDMLPGWGRYFSVSANGTLLHLEGEQGAAFRGFIPKTGNLSISWNKRPIAARLNFNYRGRQRNAPQTGAQYGSANGFYEYYDSRYNVDMNLEVTLSQRFRLFANARNILNQPQTLERYNENTPGYAHGYREEEFGVQYAVGLKGEF